MRMISGNAGMLIHAGIDVTTVVDPPARQWWAHRIATERALIARQHADG